MTTLQTERVVVEQTEEPVSLADLFAVTVPVGPTMDGQQTTSYRPKTSDSDW